MIFSPRRTTGALALGTGLLLLLPLAGLDHFLLDVLASGFLLAAYVGSWDIVGGVAGQICLGHALFFGTATYSCALLTRLAGWLFPGEAPPRGRRTTGRSCSCSFPRGA